MSKKDSLLSKKRPRNGTTKQIKKLQSKKKFQYSRLNFKDLLNKKGSPNNLGCMNILENQTLIE